MDAIERNAGHEQPIDRVADAGDVAANAPRVILSRADGEGSQADAFIPSHADGEESPADEQTLLNALGRILHIDDERRLTFLQSLLSNPQPPDAAALTLADRRILEGFMLTLWAGQEHDLDSAITRLWNQDAARRELVEFLAVLDDRAAHRTFLSSTNCRRIAERRSRTFRSSFTPATRATRSLQRSAARLSRIRSSIAKARSGTTSPKRTTSSSR